MRREARARGARLVEATRDSRVEAGRPAAAGARETVSIRTPSAGYSGLLPLPGAHQRANLVVALRLLEEAKRARARRSTSRVRRAAVAATRWPGRLQRIPGQPTLVLDGAHNPAGARALAAHLAPGPPFVLVFGAMSDKDVRGLAQALFPLAAAVVLTTPRDRARRVAGHARAPRGSARARRAPRAERRARAAARTPPGAGARARDASRRRGQPLPGGRRAGPAGARGRLTAHGRRQVSRKSVARSTRRQTISWPIPGPSGTWIVPRAETTTGGSTRSSSK